MKYEKKTLAENDGKGNVEFNKNVNVHMEMISLEIYSIAPARRINISETRFFCCARGDARDGSCGAKVVSERFQNYFIIHPINSLQKDQWHQGGTFVNDVMRFCDYLTESTPLCHVKNEENCCTNKFCLTLPR